MGAEVPGDAGKHSMKQQHAVIVGMESAVIEI